MGRRPEREDQREGRQRGAARVPLGVLADLMGGPAGVARVNQICPVARILEVCQEALNYSLAYLDVCRVIDETGRQADRGELLAQALHRIRPLPGRRGRRRESPEELRAREYLGRMIEEVF